MQKILASALWCLQLVHLTMLCKESNNRLVVMDNFYTRHLLAIQVHQMSDKDINVIGAIRFNTIDEVKRAFELAKNAPRGTFYLCHALTRS